jgi:transposase-like protein
VRSGKVGNKYLTKQGYRCKDCKRFFAERDGFEGMTYPKEIHPNLLGPLKHAGRRPPG